jgi:hypothetical protein
MTRKTKTSEPSLFDWLAGDSKPNYLGYRRCDPDRVKLMYAIMKDADEERARAARKERVTLRRKFDAYD